MRRAACGCHNLIISAACAGRGARRAAGGAAGGRRPRASRSRASAPRPARQGPRYAAQRAGDKRPVVKQKECRRRRFEAPGAGPRALITHFNYDTDRIN